MHKLLRSAVLGSIALAVVVASALGQDQEQQPPDLSKYAGVYSVEIPDYGVLEIGIVVTEENGLTLSAMGNTMPLTHISGDTYELDSPDYGIISIGFVEEEDGSISALTADGYEFSFVAAKQKQ